jgi:hypothetical protein
MENHLLVLFLSLLIASFEAYHAYKLRKTIKALIVYANRNQSQNAQKEIENVETFNKSEHLLKDSNK